MYKINLQYRPFLDRPLTTENIEVPSDIVSLLEIGKQVQRFNYGGKLNIMFHDHTECHTRRIALHTANIPESGFLDHAKIMRMAWIHDLPESVAQAESGSDVLGYLSNAHQDIKELETAKHILSPADYELYVLMEHNKHELKSQNVGDWNLDPEAVVFKIVDWIPEGLVSWIWYITRWLKSDAYTTDMDAFPEGSVQHFVRLPQHIYNRINSLSDKHDPMKQYVMRMLREDYFYPMLHLWSQVPEERIPKEFQTVLPGIRQFCIGVFGERR